MILLSTPHMTSMVLCADSYSYSYICCQYQKSRDTVQLASCMHANLLLSRKLPMMEGYTTVLCGLLVLLLIGMYSTENQSTCSYSYFVILWCTQTSSLFQCQPYTDQSGLVYTPNIPDFYFSDVNAADFRSISI